MGAFRDQPTKFLPAESTRCIRPYDTAKDRGRLGTTPGIVKFFNQQFGSGQAIQLIDTVSLASVVAGYHLGSHEDIIGRNVVADPITGQVFGFTGGPEPLLEWRAKIDVTGDGGPGTLAAACISKHADTDLTVVGTEQYNDTAHPVDKVCRVVAFDRYGAQVWSTLIAVGGTNVFINTVSVGTLYTFVASNEKVYALRNDTGAIAASTNCNSWSSEVIEARIFKDSNGIEYVFALFDGATNGVVLPSTVAVTAGFYAKCFRSGVMKFQVPTDNYSTTPIFNQVVWGRQLASTDTYYEATHNYFRISENSSLRPRGAITEALAVDGQGNVYIARCNCGGGPNNGFTPDLTLVRPISVCKVSALGTMLWEIDTDSIIRVGSQGVLNDIPTAPGIEPSLAAIAVDGTNGIVYVGGAPNAALQNVFSLNGADGSLRWTAELHAPAGPPNKTVRQACIRIDPTDGNLVIGGDDSTDYSGGGSPAAHTWKMNSIDGSVLWHLQLANVTNTGVTISRDGRIILATGQV